MGRKSIKEEIYVYVLHRRNYHNIIKQLYANKKKSRAKVISEEELSVIWRQKAASFRTRNS